MNCHRQIARTPIRLTNCIITLVGVLSSVPCQAALFTNEADFLTAVGPASLESFEGLTVGSEFIPPDESEIVVSDFTLSNGTGSNQFDIRDTDAAGTFATEGTQYIVWYANQSPDTFDVTFSFLNPVDAFGVNITDHDQGTLTFASDTGENGNIPVAAQSFIGITSAGMTSVTFTRSALNNSLGFDEVYFVNSNAIPEPSTFALAALGMLFVIRRRRKR